MTPSGIVLVRAPKGTNEGTIEYLLKKYEKEIVTGLKDMEEARKKVAEQEAEEKAEAERNSLEKSLNFCGTEIKYKIVFDDRNAGSIVVTHDLSVVVTVPRFFSVWEAEDFAERHKDGLSTVSERKKTGRTN
ncbi:MAG: hypothetical protein LUD47_03465 [Clostridia bacterium]|nr:hypothetical protein [Clostridia bacterium]